MTVKFWIDIRVEDRGNQSLIVNTVPQFFLKCFTLKIEIGRFQQLTRAAGDRFLAF